MNGIIGACLFLIALLLWCKEKITDIVFLFVVCAMAIAIGMGITVLYIKYYDTGLPLYQMIIQDYSAMLITSVFALVIVVVKIMK